MIKSLILIILFFKFCTSLDALTTNQSIKDGQSLISKDNNYALGFFSPSNSSHQYHGIWYVKVTQQTVVWIANRNDPLNDSSGVLSINQYGDLVLHDSNNGLLWSTNLHDSGNLVLVQDNNKKVLWQSFDYPTDTWLPNMKLGLYLRTGINIYKMNPNGSPQVFLYNGSTPYWRTPPWPWYNVSNATASSVEKVVLDNTGLLQKLMWDDGVHQWMEQWSTPKYRCDKYGQCGSYSKCNPDNINMFECMCLPGYEPRSPRDWYLRDGSEGCVRKNSGFSMCKNGEGFVKLERLNLPDSSFDAAWIGMSMSSSYMNIDGKGTGCLAWYGELMDILQFTDEGSELNVRVDATELAKCIRKSKGSPSKKRKLAIALLSIAVPMFLVSLLAYIWLMKKKKTKGSFEGNELKDSGTHPDLLIFNLSCMVAATENFSPTNKLGQGGFGSVFKGQLSNGQQIAVKRLSKSSRQGMEEIKNEVMLIAKLQHRNLVKLLGYCIQEEEKMLIYENMPNKSLDSFIFDHTRSSFLNWSNRFEIIIGIARGILYLHQDSRLKIIHRDLKANNVLLDAEMNPKISDFDMARIFKEGQTQDKTTKYTIFGKFPIKSNVFSFGVILLEIVSGKKNSDSYQKHPSLTLIGHVWELWREDRALDVLDSSIKEAFGLLCVQEEVVDRPTMLAVHLMLSSERALPFPKQPAFIFRRPSEKLDSVTRGASCTINEVKITVFEAR
ncbi:hypothetical protein ACB098_05G014900 [Castanea mollissima]